MSIWSSLGEMIQPLYNVEYGWDPEDTDDASYLDLATAGSFYDGNGLRISLCGHGSHACALMSRVQAEELVKRLQSWLADTARAQ